MCTKSQLEAIEEEMVNYYRSVYGDSIDTIILYGSYARGDYSDDSDIDITAIVRLGYAKQRLETTNDPITTIWLDSGFESQRTFNRVFKEKYKVSPSEYRRTLYENLGEKMK